MVTLDLEVGQSESLLQLENIMMFSRKTLDKKLEITLKVGMNTKLPTYDDKGVFTDDEGKYRKRK